MPLTEPINIEKRETKEFPPIPKDIYQVELLDISIQERPTYDTRLKSKEEQIIEKVFCFQFTLLEGKDKDGKDLRGRNVWANFIPSYLYISKKNGKNKLYRIVEALLGHELTPTEEATLDISILNGLIGKQCRLSVEPIIKGDKHFDSPTDWFKTNNLLASLTDEEKETARVKPKEEKEDEKEIDLTEIPF